MTLRWTLTSRRAARRRKAAHSRDVTGRPPAAQRPSAIRLLTPWSKKENNLAAKVRNFVKGEVKDEEDALKGARDILAEQISEDERSRNLMRNQFQRQALIQSKVVKGKEAEEASAKYRDYFDFCEPLKKCSSHRLLALRRGESDIESY